jgi:hypothetical protein
LRFPDPAGIRTFSALTLLLLVAGCSFSLKSPVQPSGQSRASNSGLISATSKVVSATIDGAVGGVLRNGDWTATIPAGSFTGKGLVTVVVPDPAVRSCEVSVVPSQATVTLTCRLQSQDEVRTYVMQRWDPGTRAWKVIDSETGSKALSCDAKLLHVSTYRCGKATA